jgi:pimeloyl-ACP methyl ester carboxylesterase
VRRSLLLIVSVTYGTGLPACGGGGQPLPPEAHLELVRTADGWELALVEYRAKPPAKGRPVLLLHGVAANSRNLDIDAEHSLARWLASQGRDAWTLSLRATGDSDFPDPAKGRRSDFTFETYWQQDLPAAIHRVRERTGADAIDFVGHSMGGMLLYAYLAEGGQGVANAVALASPTRLDWGVGFLPLLEAGTALLGDAVPVMASAHFTVDFHGSFRGEPVETLLYTHENTSDQTWKRLIGNGLADVRGTVARHLLAMIRSGKFDSTDGTLDYRKDMGRIRVPVLVVAGKADRLAVTPAVKDGYRALGGPKEWLLLGQEDGEQADYGHMDLVTGDRAPTEVWPRVLEFLDRHAHDKTVASQAGPP